MTPPSFSDELTDLATTLDTLSDEAKHLALDIENGDADLDAAYDAGFLHVALQGLKSDIEVLRQHIPDEFGDDGD